MNSEQSCSYWEMCGTDEVFDYLKYTGIGHVSSIELLTQLQFILKHRPLSSRDPPKTNELKGSSLARGGSNTVSAHKVGKRPVWKQI